MQYLRMGQEARSELPGWRDDTLLSSSVLHRDGQRCPRMHRRRSALSRPLGTLYRRPRHNVGSIGCLYILNDDY